MKQILSYNEYINLLNESGIRGIKDLAKNYKEAEIYFHMDLDGVTSAIGMKSYLESYGIKVVNAHHIQYGGREFEVSKPKEGRLAVMVDFAHGKPMMHIHTDHHDSQSGVASSTATDFKHAPSNAGTISQEISPRDIFPPDDMKLINMVDSANFALNNITVDDVLKAAYTFDKKLGIEKNKTYMGLVVNKMLLAFKNKKGFLEEVVMKSNPSLVNMFTVIRKIATDNGYPIDELTDKTENYVAAQKTKLKELTNTKDIFKLGNGEHAMFGKCIVQYGGGYMTKGGYDRYVIFKNNPNAEYMVIGWAAGLVQAAKNPFLKGLNKYSLGDIAKKILLKYKSKLEKEIKTLGDIKRLMEIDISKKGNDDSFGFTYNDFEALFNDSIKGIAKNKKGDNFKELLKDISNKHYDKLTYKQKQLLNSVSVTMWDVIEKQSGGHKDITNISGLNFLGKGYTEILKSIMTDLVEELQHFSLEKV